MFDIVKLKETCAPDVMFSVMMSKTSLAFGNGGGPIEAIKDRDDTESFIEILNQILPSTTIWDD